MSRLIVKNLPKKATEDSLRKLFQGVGTITEVCLKRNSRGGYAFIGYHNENDCETAINSFNNTFFNTNKLSVELCRPIEKKSKDTTEDKEKSKSLQKDKTDETELLEKYKNDPMFEEFLQLHDSNKIQQLKDLRINESKETEERENDEKIQDPVEQNKQEEPQKKKKEVKLFTVKLQNLPWHFVKKDIKDFFRPIRCFSIRTNSRMQRLAFVGFLNEKLRQQALFKDKSYMKGRCIRVKKCNEEINDETNKRTAKNKKWTSQEETLKNEESIAESGKIFIRNLAYTVTEDEVEKLFLQYGPLSEVDLPVDLNTKQMKGFGTITFLLPEHAVKAYSALDGSIFHGRLLHILPGKNKDKAEGDEGTNYKEKKQKARKANAGKSHNWNALFVDSNAVAEVIAERYGTSKEALIGPEGKGSAPVRLALAETQIVTETKNYLEKMGVKLDAFNNSNQKRSKTVILIKNLPAKTVIGELRKIFEKHGQLGRIILPPSGLTAIVEFLEPSQARKAFTNLAYSKFKDAPLYLEWAPLGSLEGNDVDANENDKHTKEIKNIETENKPIEPKVENKPEKIVADLGTTLFVKNLNTVTRHNDLKKHFETCGQILYVSINEKRKGKSTESLGTGFVRFIDQANAEKALNDLQDSTLDGNIISVMKSDRMEKDDLDKVYPDSSKQDTEKKLKILVKNVPFEATSREVEEIFRTFGGIKSVRLPKKWAADGTHRGFGFVEFTNEKDAKIAFEALGQSTHLLGRRLNLEWAKVEDDAEETRKRTAKHFWGEEKKKKSKKSVFRIK